MDCSIAPLTEPDMRTTHPALWIGPSKCQLKLGRYLRGVKFHPSGFQRYQSSCEPGNRIGPRHARTVGLVPNTPAAIRGTGGSPAARPHCQKMPEKEAGSLLLTHDDSSQPTADMSVEYTQSLDTLFRAEPEVRSSRHDGLLHRASHRTGHADHASGSLDWSIKVPAQAGQIPAGC